MKKILLSLCALLLLAGCTDAHAKLKDANTALITIGDTTITKGDIYSSMIQQGSGYVALSAATQAILEKEVPITDEITAEATKSLETYKATYGDSLEAALQSYGYKDVDDFYNNSLVLSAQLTKLTKKYVNENFDALVTKYEPRQATVLTFGTEEDAKNAKAELESGVDAMTVASNYNSSSAGSPRIITTDTDLDVSVKSFIQNATAPGISDVIIGTDVENFYIVNVNEIDPNNIKEDVITVFANMASTATDSDKFYFQKYGFKIYDRELYDNIKTNYPDYLFN